MNNAFISLGTNIEPRWEYLQQALALLEQQEEIDIVKMSSVYETKPVGYLDQGNFLNMVIQAETSLASMDLLSVCQKIEAELGRKREIRFGPRTIDLDILTFNQENSTIAKLTLPHPRMHERAFVLIPFAEISPHFYINKWNKTVSELKDSLPQSEINGVRVWRKTN